MRLILFFKEIAETIRTAEKNFYQKYERQYLEPNFLPCILATRQFINRTNRNIRNVSNFVSSLSEHGQNFEQYIFKFG